MKWLIPISLAALGGTAHADQCQWVDKAVAAKAAAILESSPKIIAFCEPCGDKVPGIPEVVERVETVTPDAGYRELFVNRRGVDLAYTYVQTSDVQYANLAALAGCDAHGVSPTLAVQAETPGGVLIVADTAPVPEPAAAIAPPAPVAAPPAPATRSDGPLVTVHVHSQTTTSTVPWLAFALVAGGGALAGAMLALSLLVARRRRAMRPRAAELR